MVTFHRLKQLWTVVKDSNLLLFLVALRQINMAGYMLHAKNLAMKRVGSFNWNNSSIIDASAGVIDSSLIHDELTPD